MARAKKNPIGTPILFGLAAVAGAAALWYGSDEDGAGFGDIDADDLNFDFTGGEVLPDGSLDAVAVQSFPEDPFSESADHFMPSAELHLDELAAQASTGAGLDVSALGPEESDGWIPEEALDAAIIPDEPELQQELGQRKKAIMLVKTELMKKKKHHPSLFRFRTRRAPDGGRHVVAIRKSDRARVGFLVSADGSVKFVKKGRKRVVKHADAVELRRAHLRRPAIIRVGGIGSRAVTKKLPVTQAVFDQMSAAQRAQLAAQLVGVQLPAPAKKKTVTRTVTTVRGAVPLLSAAGFSVKARK